MMSPHKRRRGSRRGRARPSHHTSHPTGRAAYAETRQWLLSTHGPVCAYCGGTYAARTLTLDHVTPRRGQTAYDRRDNLVLACKRCNSAKADKPFLTYLLANRSRAKHLYVYGQHLSHGILDMLRHMVGHEVDLQAPRETAKPTRHVFGSTDDEESPYREESPYKDDETASPARGSSRRGARQPRAEGRPSKSRPRKPASRDKQRQPKQRGGRGRRSA